MTYPAPTNEHRPRANGACECGKAREAAKVYLAESDLSTRFPEKSSPAAQKGSV